MLRLLGLLGLFGVFESKESEGFLVKTLALTGKLVRSGISGQIISVINSASDRGSRIFGLGPTGNGANPNYLRSD